MQEQPNARQKVPTLETFWDFVEKTDGCWLWTGRLHSSGYGRFFNGEREVRAHRFSWEQAHNRKIPPGYFICHHCDNPPCVRPDHLFLGRPADNSADMAAKGRGAVGGRNAARKYPLIHAGERNGNAKLTTADVLHLRDARARGASTIDLARHYGVSRTLIYRICARDAWKHV